jgi:hypothetical protein
VDAHQYFGFDHAIPAEVERDCVLKVKPSDGKMVIG